MSRYEVKERVGMGGMGEVWRAFDTVLLRDVALKYVRADLPTSSQWRERMLREARLAANLDHSGICAVYDVGELEGRPFVAMEFLCGETLRQRIVRSGPMQVQEVLRIAGSVAGAMAAAHRRGIVHRDIKPENVMVLPDGRVKVLDFGLAKPVDTDGAEIAVRNEAARVTESSISQVGGTTLRLSEGAVTTPGQLLGTYQYLSPEQIEARPPDARSDVFTFGVVLYEMLSGRQPFAGPTVSTLLSAIRSEQPTPIEGLRPDAPPALVQIVGRCLKKAPESRFRDGEALAAAIEDTVQAMASRPAPVGGWRKSMAAAGVALALMVALAGATTWREWKGSPASSAMAAKPPVTFLPRIRQLTFDGVSTSPKFSPDGTLIAMNRGGDRASRPAIMPAAGGEATPLAVASGEFGVVGWSPNSDSLVVTRLGGPSALELWKLRLADGTASKWMEYTQTPVYDSNGRWMAFSRWVGPRRPGQEQNILLRELATGQDQILAAGIGRGLDCRVPRWSPDDSRVAFSCYEIATGKSSAWAVDPITGDRKLFATRGLVIGGAYDWTPDGTAIIAGATRQGSQNLWVLPLEGRGAQPRQLTTGPDRDAAVTAHAASGQVVFARSRQERELLLLPTTSGSPRVGSTLRWPATGTSFSPDGTEIFGTEERNGLGTIVAIDPGSGNRRTIMSDERRSCSFPLQLDDTDLAFSCDQATDIDTTTRIQFGGAWIRTVWVIDLAAGGSQALFSEPGPIELLAASPSGRKINYIVSPDESSYDLKVFDRSTGKASVIVHGLRLWEPIGHGWGPDENVIFLVRSLPKTSSGGRTVWLEKLDLVKGARTRVMSLPSDTLYAYFSRDGHTMAIAIGKDHFYERILLRPTTQAGPARTVYAYDTGPRIESLSLSPDGGLMALQRVDRHSDLFLLDYQAIPTRSP